MSFNSFDISASGLYAQRLKMDTISSNIANINTTRNADGTPGAYVKKEVVFEAALNEAQTQPDWPTNGVAPEYHSESGSMMLKGNINFETPVTAQGVQVSNIVEANDPYKMVYEPGHPDANEDGFVQMPNINIVTEMVDMMTASRAYEANVTSVQATKSMISAAMKI